MSKIFTESAGMLLFRRKITDWKFFWPTPEAHSGQKRCRSLDHSQRSGKSWRIYLAGSLREFEEETGIKPAGDFLPLGSIRQKAGKTVHAWAWEGDADPNHTTSNLMK
jgi:predicted NUDIX family NTP pyrophosphohydrolase